MIPPSLRLLTCTVIFQCILGCTASLSEQCNQLNNASDTDRTEAFSQKSREKKGEFLAAAHSRTAEKVRSLKISDPNLKDLQAKFAKNDDEFAKAIIDGIDRKNAGTAAKREIEISNERMALAYEWKSICSK